MAWTPPRTWLAGEFVDDEDLNEQLRDNLLAAFPLGVDAWTTFTPTLTQSGTVTKTVTYARYCKVGRLIIAECQLAVTGSGTSSNKVQITLPVSPAFVTNQVVGSGWLVDASAPLNYSGVCISESGGPVIIMPNAQLAGLGQVGFTAALASGDTVGYSIAYEAAS